MKPKKIEVPEDLLVACAAEYRGSNAHSWVVTTLREGSKDGVNSVCSLLSENSSIVCDVFKLEAILEGRQSGVELLMSAQKYARRMRLFLRLYKLLPEQDHACPDPHCPGGKSEGY